MAVLKVILTVVFLIISLALIVIVLLQEGKSAGLTGSISGAAETFWGKNGTISPGEKEWAGKIKIESMRNRICESESNREILESAGK